jgi:nitrogen fixation protein NifX
MRVAIATQDGQNANGHFGSARIFQFFELTQDGARFLEEQRFDSVSAEDGQHQPEEEDHLSPKILAIEGCAMLVVADMGNAVALRVARANVHPIKLSTSEPIPSVLSRIQEMLKSTPPPTWLRRLVALEQAKSEHPSASHSR